MFQDCSSQIRFNPPALFYGVAACDLDRDGAFELFVCGFRGSNRVLKWDGQTLVDQADDTLADAGRMAIGVAAADFDGDGQEELYVLNTDTFGGRKRFGDRLFDWQGSAWVDLFSLPQNQDALNFLEQHPPCYAEGFGPQLVIWRDYPPPVTPEKMADWLRFGEEWVQRLRLRRV